MSNADKKLTQASAHGLTGLLASKKQREDAAGSASERVAIRPSQFGQPTMDAPAKRPTALDASGWLQDQAGASLSHAWDGGDEDAPAQQPAAVDASGWLQGQAGASSSHAWDGGDEGEEGDAAWDDDDIWEEEEEAPQDGDGEGDWPASATHGLLPGGSLTLMLDADPTAPTEQTSATPHLPEVLSAEQEQMQKMLLKAYKQQERKRAVAKREAHEGLHRIALQCWLGHGCALSAQASEPLLQQCLLGMMPAHLVPNAAPDKMSIAVLRSLMLWLPTCVGEHQPPPGTSAPGGAASSSNHASLPAEEALQLVERRWLLLLLLRAATQRDAPDWACGAAGAAAAELAAQRPVSAGAAPGFVPVSATAAATRDLLQQVAQDVHAASLLKPRAATADGAPVAGTLGESLESGTSSSVQQLLLLVALLRGFGLTARLVICLQPPLRKPPPPPKVKSPAAKSPKAKGGKGAAAAAAPSDCAKPPHPIPCWGEVHLPYENRWVSFDPFFKLTGARSGRVVCDAPEAIAQARVAGRAVACRAYIVGFGASGPAVDVTLRYVTDFRSLAPHRTGAEWWEAALAASHVPGAAPLGGHSRDAPMDLTDDTATAEAPSSAAAAEEAAEVRARLGTQPMPNSLAAFKRDPHYVLDKDVGRYEVLHPPTTAPVGLFKGQRVFPRAALQRLMSSERWFRQCRCVHPNQEPVKQIAKPGPGPGAKKKKPAAGSMAAAAAAADADEVRGGEAAEAGEAQEQMELFGEWQTYAYEPPRAIGGVVPRSARGHVEMWTEAHLPLGTVWLRQPHVHATAMKLGVDAAPAMTGFDFREGRSVPRFEGCIVCLEVAPMLIEAAAGVAEVEEDKRIRKKRKRVLAHWGTLLRALSVKARLDAQYARDDDD